MSNTAFLSYELNIASEFLCVNKNSVTAILIGLIVRLHRYHQSLSSIAVATATPPFFALHIEQLFYANIAET